MNAPQLLDTLQARGATLEREGESLRVAPSRVLDDELRAAIRCNKSELLELLQLESASRTANTRTEPRTVAPPLPPTFRNEPVTALERLQDEAALCRAPVCHGLIRVNDRLLELWRLAEIETGQTLTVAGNPRRTNPTPQTSSTHLPARCFDSMPTLSPVKSEEEIEEC